MAGYKLATYQSMQGPRAGVVVDETVFDAAELSGQASYVSMLGILEDWHRAQETLQSALAKGGEQAKALPLVQTRLRAPVLWPSAIYCAGANYSDHAAEMAKRANRPEEPNPKTLGLKPWHFIKASRSLADPEATVQAAHYTQKLDWEVELAVVIGKKASYVDVTQAPAHIAGYVLHNDYSERAFQLERGGQWVKGKSADTFAPMGPWLVAPEDVGDVHRLKMWLTVNGTKVQDGTTANMIFGVAELVSYVSGFMTLLPGDVISTGTPAGVGLGMKPEPRYLKPGDVVELGIEKLGTARQVVRTFGN